MVRALFPGTFDPIHYGHIDIARRAAKMFDELVVAVYNRPLKNLIFSPEERLQLVKKTFEADTNIQVMGYSGLTVEFCKKIDSKVIVRGLRVFSDFELEFRMALANRRLVPGVETIALITSEQHTFLSSTTVREIASLGGDISSMVPQHVVDAINRRFKEIGDNPPSFAFTSLRD